jgi:hypothetical protein
MVTKTLIDGGSYILISNTEYKPEITGLSPDKVTEILHKADNLTTICGSTV